MNVPDNAKILAQTFEGFFPKPYICPAGFWTIAWGHLCTKDHPPVTLEQGETYLSEDMMNALLATIRLCPVLMTEASDLLGSIVDFTFNLGAGRLQQSTLRRRINQRNWPEVRKELGKWVYGGGRKLPGLVLRRAAEIRFITG